MAVVQIENPGFETGDLSGWSADAGWYINSADPKSGTYKALTKIGSTEKVLRSDTVIPVSPGAMVSFSLAHNGTGTHRVELLSDTGDTLAQSLTDTRDAWHGVDCEFVIPDGWASCQVQVVAGTSGGYLRVDDVCGGGVLLVAVKAAGSVTVASINDVASTTRWYLLQSSTLTAPGKPTAKPPGGSWQVTEPTYAEGSTNSLYTCDQTIFSDGTWAYSAVSLSTSYEAAKAAYNKASAAAATAAATQDHVAAEYATKAALKVTSDAVTAEVEERGKLAGRVGTLESTTGTHTSRLQQLAASITSLVRGESTYTDPDGKSATSGIYSLVTQTRDSVTALFGDYTKTADLASTAAVQEAKKAGTDAASAASAAQSTADSAKSTADGLATMIRQDADGITVGKSADGKTYATGRTRMDEDSFDVLDKDGNLVATFSGAAISMLMGLLTITAGHNGGGEIYPATGKSLLLKSGEEAEISGNRGSYIEVNDDYVSLNSSPAGGATNSLSVGNSGIVAQTQGVGGLLLCPVHSMYNPNNGMHVYSGKASEISSLSSAGWTDEGVKFYAFLDPGNR